MQAYIRHYKNAFHTPPHNPRQRAAFSFEGAARSVPAGAETQAA
jgi:hypothetical protein